MLRIEFDFSTGALSGRAIVLAAALSAAAADFSKASPVWSSGHGDLGIEYLEPPEVVSPELEPHWHLEGGVVDGVPRLDEEFEAGDLDVRVPRSTYLDVLSKGGRPAGSAWDPMGVAAGESYWVLPQSGTLADSLGVPFLGIGTEDLAPGDWGTPITLTLTGFSGPGTFSMWQDGITPNFFMTTLDGVSGADAYAQAAGAHGHVNWGFSLDGTYQLTLQASGTHSAAGAMTGEQTFAFVVVPEPNSLGLLVLGVLGFRFLRRVFNARG